MLNGSKVILIYARPGHGKTSLIKRYLATIEPAHLYVLSASTNDDYSHEYLQRFPSWNASNDFNYDEIVEFRNKPGKKVLVLDDVLHINVCTGSNKHKFADLVSTARHHNMHIFVSVQALKILGKTVRMCAHYLLAGHIDNDVIEMATTMTGLDRGYFSGLRSQIVDHKFLAVSHDGKVSLIS